MKNVKIFYEISNLPDLLKEFLICQILFFQLSNIVKIKEEKTVRIVNNRHKNVEYFHRGWKHLSKPRNSFDLE